MGERVYAQKGDAVWTVLYMGNTAELALPSGKVKLKEETKYPWEGDVADHGRAGEDLSRST